MARSCSSFRYASVSVACAIVSDAFRYARILNGFSLLISSKSAISEKMCAMARFSMCHRKNAEAQQDSAGQDPQAFVLYTVLQDAGTSRRQRMLYGRRVLRINEAE